METVARVKITEVSLPRCGFTNHKSFGEPVEDCEKCGGEKVCGPFGHFCLTCQPTMKIYCNICETPRFKCCC